MSTFLRISRVKNSKWKLNHSFGCILIFPSLTLNSFKASTTHVQCHYSNTGKAPINCWPDNILVETWKYSRNHIINKHFWKMQRKKKSSNYFCSLGIWVIVMTWTILLRQHACWNLKVWQISHHKQAFLKSATKEKE